jgi:hypothetical protein
MLNVIAQRSHSCSAPPATQDSPLIVGTGKERDPRERSNIGLNLTVKHSGSQLLLDQPSAVLETLNLVGVAEELAS